MIESLRIRDLALVEDAELELDAGLNVLTGETGAGKSLVLSALSLLAGGRPATDTVRSEAPRTLIEAIVRTGGIAGLEQALVERELAPEDGALVVARTVAADGRSRAQVAGQWVPVSVLRELLEGRLEISSQHATQSLRRAGSHTDLLDAYAGAGAQRRDVQRLYRELRECLEAARGLRETGEERERRRDFLAFQRDEIDAAELRSGELESLGVELRRLSHAEGLREEGAAVGRALAGDDAPEGASALESIESALRALESMSRTDPGLAEAAGRLLGLRDELEDLARELARFVDRIDLDPARQAAVEERLGELERIRRKYGADEDAILAHHAAIATELEALGGEGDRVAELDARAEQLTQALATAAAQLSRARKRAAASLRREVEKNLARLEMPGARFAVAFEPVTHDEALPCGPAGAESIAFCLAANPDGPPKPLQKVASGGELSRVFLALKCAQLRGRSASGTVLVFDEVDVGIGGRAIDQVGALLKELGKSHQILCITHWPQIAAAAARHFRVSKSLQGDRSTTRVELLGEQDRIEELARMAGGARVTQATRRHARDLLRERRLSASETS